MALGFAAPSLPPAGRLLGVVAHGFEVYYDPDTDQLAHAVGVWHRRIIVGSQWFRLAARERHAILLHEAAHLLAHHLRQRLLWLPLFWTQRAARLAQQQELDADAFVAQQGYGADLLTVVVRFQAPDQRFYPSFHERTSALVKRTKERTQCGTYASS